MKNWVFGIIGLMIVSGAVIFYIFYRGYDFQGVFSNEKDNNQAINKIATNTKVIEKTSNSSNKDIRSQNDNLESSTNTDNIADSNNTSTTEHSNVNMDSNNDISSNNNSTAVKQNGTVVTSNTVKQNTNTNKPNETNNTKNSNNVTKNTSENTTVKAKKKTVGKWYLVYYNVERYDLDDYDDVDEIKIDDVCDKNDYLFDYCKHTDDLKKKTAKKLGEKKCGDEDCKVGESCFLWYDEVEDDGDVNLKTATYKCQ